jgi:hypothetical protein
MYTGMKGWQRRIFKAENSAAMLDAIERLGPNFEALNDRFAASALALSFGILSMRGRTLLIHHLRALPFHRSFRVASLVPITIAREIKTDLSQIGEHFRF